MLPSTGYDRAGSLSLKASFPMEYSRGILSNKWHQKREAEPRDHELWSTKGSKPTLHQSTYNHLQQNIPSTACSNETETRFKLEETLRIMAQEAKSRDMPKKMIDEQNKERLEANLEAYANLNQATPAHKSGHDKFHSETTYHKDYVHPYPELLNQKSELTKNKEFENSVDNSFCFRRMISQFSDIDSAKRDGINTFHVQHGEYPNQHVKAEFQQRTKNNLFNT